MTFTLVAPNPLIETTTKLPNPNFGDQEGATGELNILRTVNGRRRTYIISKDRRKLRWDFTLSRNKALELFEFYRSYNAERITIKDHNNRQWVGIITNNPFEIQMDRRGLPTRQNWPVGELCAVTIEFEGTLDTVSQAADIASQPNPQIFSSLASSRLNTLTQGVEASGIVLPTFGRLISNWDATEIIHASGDVISVWPDSGPASNDLIGTIGDIFDPAIDRSPIYRGNSSIFPGLPTVAFEAVQSQLTTSVAAMRTTSEMTLFPSKRGTIFWVFAHTINPNWNAVLEILKLPIQFFTFSSTLARFALALSTAFADKSFSTEIEFGVWSQQQGTNTGIPEVEQVHMAGASSPLFPVNIRFNPADPINELRLATSNTQPVPSLTPVIYMLSRDSDTTLRFRTNGVEREGTTILDNAPFAGTFRVNDQTWIPNFNARIRGEWGQIVTYNNVLTTTQIQDVEASLSLKWGIPLGSVSF